MWDFLRLHQIAGLGGDAAKQHQPSDIRSRFSHLPHGKLHQNQHHGFTTSESIYILNLIAQVYFTKPWTSKIGRLYIYITPPIPFGLQSQEQFHPNNCTFRLTGITCHLSKELLELHLNEKRKVWQSNEVLEF